MKKNAENTAKTRTVNALSELQIIRDGQVIESLPITNPCQMWSLLKGQALFAQYGADVTIKVIRDNGETYMEFVQGTRKNGTTFMKQTVTENRRAQVMKAKKAAAIARAKKDEKNAKARARRAAKKAAQVVQEPTTVTADENTAVAAEA